MTIANRLIILRDKHKYSQQQVANAIGVSKSTYCRYEKGTSTLGTDEINAILSLYDLSYEEFMGISLPLESEIVYPEKLLKLLESTIKENASPSGNYHEDQRKYYAIKEAMEPILSIRSEGLNFPEISIDSIEPGTTVKKVKFDLRGEKLIDEGLNAQHRLFDSMQGGFKSRGGDD